MNSLTRSDLGSFEENDQQIANFLLDERETVQFICESLSEIDFFWDKIWPLFEDGAAGAPTGLISVFKEEFSALIYLVWFWKSYEAKSDAQMEDEESSILVRQLFAGL